jgi:hypothetical protein
MEHWPASLQSFSTTAYSGKPNLLPIEIIWMPRDENLKIDRAAIDRIVSELRTRSGHELAFTIGPIDHALDIHQVMDKVAGAYAQIYFGLDERLGLEIEEGAPLVFAKNIFTQYEVPVHESPLKGTTLATILSSGGGLSMIQLFAHGVSPLDAAIAVIFASASMIVIGAADAVRRATSAAIEERLRSVFGVPAEREVMREVRRTTSKLRKKPTR